MKYTELALAFFGKNTLDEKKEQLELLENDRFMDGIINTLSKIGIIKSVNKINNGIELCLHLEMKMKLRYDERTETITSYLPIILDIQLSVDFITLIIKRYIWSVGITKTIPLNLNEFERFINENTRTTHRIIGCWSRDFFNDLWDIEWKNAKGEIKTPIEIIKSVFQKDIRMVNQRMWNLLQYR